MLGYIFGIDCQTTLQVQEKLISRLPVEIYVQLRCYCCVRILGQLSGYWATKELYKNINFAMETKAKKLNCISSYKGLNRFSLGQISELLRLTKESYCNIKLKCPDTGQHTVRMCKLKKKGKSILVTYTLHLLKYWLQIDLQNGRI